MSDRPCYLTPPQYAAELGVKPEKVIGWITRRELRAFDASDRPGVGRPRWRISPDAIREFEERRAPKPPAKRRSRRKRQAGVLDIIK